ncbi:MAG: hypothetical protein K0R10_383 [Alphaproteobacteria bacterium]|jgi:hypothetical protein|nr:hypothetical protein [Alphaproteobacteria bacterium]
MTAEYISIHGDASGAGGVPLRDALIGIYAAYYMGSQDNPVKDHLNAHFNLRAKNAFNMTAAMEHAFGKEDSPWIVLDHLSDKRRDAENKTEALHGAHFLTLYHRASGRVMIAMPGLESDDNPGDTLMDIKEMAIGGMRGQSTALYNYTMQVEKMIADGAFRGADGNPLPVTGGIVIGAHSMGCTAAQMMAIGGYQTVLVEPRPVHDGLINRIADNYAKITGHDKPDAETVVEKLDASAVNIRSRHSNVWNSIILPWIKQRETGQSFAYTTEGHNVVPADRGIGTFHRVEMSVPSINGIREARAYEEKAIVTQNTHHNNLITDILQNAAKNKPQPKK